MQNFAEAGIAKKRPFSIFFAPAIPIKTKETGLKTELADNQLMSSTNLGSNSLFY
jgi:hypothetical protein